MKKEESSKEENPLIYYAVILVALGIVAYKWITDQNINTLINLVINILSCVVGITLLLLIIVF